MCILKGSGSEDSLPHLIHEAWLRPHSSSRQKAVLCIASMEALATEHRITCIKKFQSVSEVMAYDLRRCLLSPLQREASAMIELAEIITSLDNDSNCEAWQSLLLCVLERDEFRVDQENLTSLGFASYRYAISILHSFLGENLAILSAIHGWLSVLSSFEPTLKAIQDRPKSTNAMHCLLTGYQVPDRDRYLEMLHCIQSQPDERRKEFMLELVLFLTRNMSGTVCRAVLCDTQIGSCWLLTMR